MRKQMRNNLLKTVMGLFMFSLLLVACNNSKDEKKDTPVEDTTSKMEPTPVPEPIQDTMTKKPIDTADTRPVKPTE